jgi:hypothetical protein
VGLGELQIPPLRFGRDDKFVALVGRCVGLGELQIPPLRFASVGMTNLLLLLGVAWVRGTADPSTSLRFGRDDKFVALVGGCVGLGELQIPCTSMGFGPDDTFVCCWVEGCVASGFDEPVESKLQRGCAQLGGSSRLLRVRYRRSR